MGLPLLAKDLIKETMMSVLVDPDVDASQMIGQATIEVMYAVAGACSSGAILERISTAPPPSPVSRDSVVLSSRCSVAVIARSRSPDIESAHNIGILATLIFSGRT